MSEAQPPPLPQYPSEPEEDPGHILSVEDWVAVEEERKRLLNEEAERRTEEEQ